MIPQFLYRYGFIPATDNSEHAQKLEWLRIILIQNKIYFPSPFTFNDPFDCKILPNLSDLSRDEILKTKKDMAPPTLKGADKIKFNTQVENLHKLAIKDGRDINNDLEDYWTDANKHLGVLCLSEAKDNILMYAYYGNGHKGYCLEFDTNLITQSLNCKIYPVQYQDEYPDYKYSECDSSLEHLKKRLLTKASDWKHEKEYRIIKLPQDLPKDRMIPFSPESLTGITFGCLIDPSVQKAIENINNERPNPLKIYKLQTHRTRFELFTE